MFGYYWIQLRRKFCKLIFRGSRYINNPYHSSYAYFLLIESLKMQDRDIIENKKLRNAIITGINYVSFSDIKLKFFKRMEAEGKLICVYCQRDLKVYYKQSGKLPEDMATIDHWIPLAHNGLKYVESNFLCSCPECNLHRGINPSYKITDTKYIWCR